FCTVECRLSRPVIVMMSDSGLCGRGPYILYKFMQVSTLRVISMNTLDPTWRDSTKEFNWKNRRNSVILHDADVV
ncbi:hypothetical protein L9F63_023530, partial [Diploptera punctata]